MIAKLENLNQSIQETKNKISILENIRSSIRFYQFNYIAKLEYKEIVKELNKQKELLKKLKASQKNDNVFCKENNEMNYKLLAQKLIENGIEWLDEIFGSFKGKTTELELDEVLTMNQLKMLCNEINQDERVRFVRIETDGNITINFLK